MNAVRTLQYINVECKAAGYFELGKHRNLIDEYRKETFKKEVKETAGGVAKRCYLSRLTQRANFDLRGDKSEANCSGVSSVGSVYKRFFT